MERLTEKRQGQNVIPLRQDGKRKWSICSAGMGDAPAKYLYGDAADRLAAYEDTKLPPEICAEYKKFEDEAVSKGVTFSRIVELMHAEAEDRLLVLPPPAKEGDPKPECFYTDFSGPWCLGRAPENGDEPTERCLQCWYCESGYYADDREEAEAALAAQDKPRVKDVDQQFNIHDNPELMGGAENG